MRSAFVIPLLAALASAGLPLHADAPEQQPAGARTIPSVTVAAAKTARMRAQVPVAGTLVARRQVQVHAQVVGFEITQIMAEAGDRVEQGQVLARLATDTLSAQLAQAEAEYQRADASVSQARSAIDSAAATSAQTTAALERAQRLRDQGNASQAALDQAVAAEAGARAQQASSGDGLAVAQAALAQADAARRIAALNLSRADITAPVAGLVVERTAERGALSGAGMAPFFTLIADGTIEMSAEVIETALGGLAPGAPAQIEVAGLGRIGGHVRLVPASVDPVTRLGVMRIALDDQPGLRTGLFASGWVLVAERDAVTVPAAAVLSDAAGDRVQVVADGVVETRPVTAGLLWDGRREIVKGLALGEQVIARSGPFFRGGDRVNGVTPPDQMALDDASPRP